MDKTARLPSVFRAAARGNLEATRSAEKLLTRGHNPVATVAERGMAARYSAHQQGAAMRRMTEAARRRPPPGQWTGGTPGTRKLVQPPSKIQAARGTRQSSRANLGSNRQGYMNRQAPLDPKTYEPISRPMPPVKNPAALHTGKPISVRGPGGELKPRVAPLPSPKPKVTFKPGRQVMSKAAFHSFADELMQIL